VREVTNGDDLYTYAKTIGSRAEFIRFIERLNADFKAKPSQWENDSLEAYLSGLSGFAHDMQGYYKNVGEIVDVENITWRMAAQMLLAAKVYGN
jgi:hypothetical protein